VRARQPTPSLELRWLHSFAFVSHTQYPMSVSYLQGRVGGGSIHPCLRFSVPSLLGSADLGLVLDPKSSAFFQLFFPLFFCSSARCLHGADRRSPAAIHLRSRFSFLKSSFDIQAPVFLEYCPLSAGCPPCRLLKRYHAFQRSSNSNTDFFLSQFILIRAIRTLLDPILWARKHESLPGISELSLVLFSFKYWYILCYPFASSESNSVPLLRSKSEATCLR
jgi:hypothetical protein